MNTSDQSELRLQPGPEGVQVFWKGRPLLGRQPAAGQSRRLPPEPQEQTLYLLRSPLLGEGAKPFLRSLSPESAAILLEFDPALASLKDHPSAIQPGPSGGWVTDPARFGYLAHTLIRRHALRRVVGLSLSGAARFNHSAYETCESVAEDLIRSFWNNRGTEIRLGRRWLSNIWKNAPAATTIPASLKRHFRGRAILAGAGPSLDRAIPFIRKAQSMGLPVVATDTALPALAEARIAVDLIIALDGQLANAADMVPWRWDGSFLVADVSTHHAIVRSFPESHRYLICTRFSDIALFDSPLLAGFPQFLPRGSVGPAAVEILHRLFGVSRILGAGFDFWYRLPRTHASLTMHHRAYLARAGRLDGTDGPASRVDRPWKRLVLEDGTREVSDQILASQAEQCADLISTISRNDVRFRFLRLPGRGLFPGGSRLSWDEAERWLSAEETAPEAIRTGTDETGDERIRQRRLAGLEELYARLAAQEKLLADPARPVFLDAELEFAWFDLPQWPLLNLRREWAEMHRPRLLQAVRDHRRRVGRAHHAVADITLRDSP
jgi:hypothetical protein